MIGPNCMGLIVKRDAACTRPDSSHCTRRRDRSAWSRSRATSACRSPRHLNGAAIGIDKFISVGNEAQVGAVDVLDYLRTDERTRCILMYLEGIDDGRRFMEVARADYRRQACRRAARRPHRDRAARRPPPTPAPWRDRPPCIEAAARQAGVITCTAADDALDMAMALAHLPLPRGRRVAVVTNGGGVGVLAADELARRGLDARWAFREALMEELDGILPPFWSRQNPARHGGVGRRRRGAAGARSGGEQCHAVDAVIVLSVVRCSQHR